MYRQIRLILQFDKNRFVLALPVVYLLNDVSLYATYSYLEQIDLLFSSALFQSRPTLEVDLCAVFYKVMVYECT